MIFLITRKSSELYTDPQEPHTLASTQEQPPGNLPLSPTEIIITMLTPVTLTSPSSVLGAMSRTAPGLNLHKLSEGDTILVFILQLNILREVR